MDCLRPELHEERRHMVAIGHADRRDLVFEPKAMSPVESARFHEPVVAAESEWGWGAFESGLLLRRFEVRDQLLC